MPIKAFFRNERTHIARRGGNEASLSPGLTGRLVDPEAGGPALQEVVGLTAYEPGNSAVVPLAGSENRKAVPDSLLDDYSAARRPIARSVVSITDRMTRLATLPRVVRPLRNVVFSIVGRIPKANRSLAWRLSGLVYR